MKILIIDYKPGKGLADIYTAATASGHQVIVAAAEDSTDTRLHTDIHIGNSIDRAMHRFIGYLSDSYNLHSTRPTSTLLNRIVTINPDIIHIYNVEEPYLNLPLLAYVLTQYKIPTLITLGNPDNLYRNKRALIKRISHNSNIFTGTFASWDLLHLAFREKICADHEISAFHPGYYIDPVNPASSYCQIYEAMG